VQHSVAGSVPCLQVGTSVQQQRHNSLAVEPNSNTQGADATLILYAYHTPKSAAAAAAAAAAAVSNSVGCVNALLVAEVRQRYNIQEIPCGCLAPQAYLSCHAFH